MARASKLEELHRGIVDANEEEDRRYDRAREAVHDGLLNPFAETFARPKNVELCDLVNLDPLPESGQHDAEVEPVRISALGALGSMAGGVAVGAGAAATTFVAVGAFATASTGTAISSLSGVAATNAILAWLGGGSIAAGGGGVALGTTVLAGIFALPTVAVVGTALHLKGRRACREQKEISQKLDGVEADFRVAETRCAAARERSA